MIDFQSFQDRLQNKWCDKVFNNSFDQGSDLCSDKKSDSDTDDIVLRKKGHKFFEHLFVIKDKIVIDISDYSFFSSDFPL